MNLNINQKIKNILLGVLVVVVGVIAVVSMITNPGPEHIEDTNGADNYSLQSITENDVIEQTMGSRGTVQETEMHYDFADLSISSGRKYSSKEFTGVSCIYTTTLFKGSDIYVSLAEFEINEGNFAFYVVFDGEVVGQVTPSEAGFSEFTLSNVEKTGSLEYVIAGESADFSFVVSADFD